MKISIVVAARHNLMDAPIKPANTQEVSNHNGWNYSAERQHLARLAQVAQATASAIIITDIDGVTVWVNEGFTRITGYGLDEAVGCTPGQLLQGADTDRDEAARIGAALRARQSVAAELINYAKDGRRYWIGMKIEPLFAADGEFEGFMAIEADITERHERNIAVEQLTRRFDMATRGARVGAFERDASWEFVWWNEVMWDIFGQDPVTFKPTHELWLGLIHAGDRDRIRQELIGLKRSRAALNLQYRVIRPDGELRHIQAICAPAYCQYGLVSHVAGITLDVTERVQAEEREQALQGQLRESSRLAGIAEIATGVLHNVGNVLNSLGIANTTARRDLTAMRLDRLEQASALLVNNRATLASFLTDDERGRHLPDFLPALSAQISCNARTIQAELQTTEQLLGHLGDIVATQQELAHLGGRRESIRLNDLVETALLVQASELAHIEVVREYQELPPIMTDRHKLVQILVNLLRNARDAVQADAPGRARIVVKLDVDGDHVVATIEDSGTGMSDEVLSQIWRFGFTTKKNGHGFGLHNSANAAQELGATLTAYSDGIGRGSRFVLRLPIGNPRLMHSGLAA